MEALFGRAQKRARLREFKDDPDEHPRGSILKIKLQDFMVTSLALLVGNPPLSPQKKAPETTPGLFPRKCRRTAT